MELFGYLAGGLIVFIGIVGVIKVLFDCQPEEKRFLRYLKKEVANCSRVHICNPKYKLENRVLNVELEIYYEAMVHHTIFYTFDFKNKTYNEHRVNRKKEKEGFYEGSLESGQSKIKNLIGAKN